MPYLVQLVEEQDNGGEDVLNRLEADGWTLVQVIQAYGDYTPQFIFHKED